MTDKFWYDLCEGLIGPKYTESLGDKKKKVIERVADFVTGQLSSLPVQLRIALNVGLFAFKLYTFVITFKTINALSTTKRNQIIETWASGNISIARKLFRPLRSLTVLAFFEQPEVASLLNQ